jgi:hypothetical protein
MVKRYVDTNLTHTIDHSEKVFLPPDLAFGNNTVLSVRGTTGATYVSLDQLGKTRNSALFNAKNWYV